MARRVVWVVALFVVAGMLSPTSAGILGDSQDYTMDQLLQPGMEVTVGDKIFGDWRYQATGSGLIPPTDEIIISFGFDDASQVAKLGYQVVAHADSPGQTVDLLWIYTVRTASGLPEIKDVGVNLIGSGTYPVNVPGAPSVTIIERIYDGDSTADPQIAALSASDVDPVDYVDWEGTYGPVSEITVFKNLLLNAGDSEGAWAHISYMEQEISQVPEASSFALFGLGLVGLGLCRRFRRRSE